MPAQHAVRDSTSDVLPAERVLHLFQVLEEEYASFHANAPDPLPWKFAADQIRDLPGLVAMLRARATPAHAYVWRRLSEATRSAVDGFVADRPPPEQTHLRDRLAAELNELLHADLASQAEIRAAAERPFSLSLLENYPERVGAVSTEQGNRWLLEDAFPKVLLRIEDLRINDVYRRIHEKQGDDAHAALCLSGGGIRSATFALGVVQGLARHHLLNKFHYLSTVSGGGYLGSWLSAWMHHGSPRDVIEQLDPHPHVSMEQRTGASPTVANHASDTAAAHPPMDPHLRTALKPEPAPIRHLRSYSNYLSPRLGFFSADTWTLIATMARNLFLTWLVLVPLLTAVVLVPHLARSVLAWQPLQQGAGQTLLIGGMLLLALLFGVVAVAYVHATPSDAPTTDRAWSDVAPGDQSSFLRFCLVPLLASTMLLTTVWGWIQSPAAAAPPAPFRMLLAMTAFGVALHLAGWYVGRSLPPWRRAGVEADVKGREAVVIAATGAVGGAAAFGAAWLLQSVLAPLPPRLWYEVYTVVALPGLLLVLLFGGQLYLGLVSSYRAGGTISTLSARLKADDASREWAARFAAWVLIAATAWLTFGALVLLMPLVVNQWLHHLAGGGLVTGLAAALLGRSPRTSAAPQGSGNLPASGGTARWSAVLLPVAALLFLAILVVLLSALGVQLVRLGAVALGIEYTAAPPPALVATAAAVLLFAGHRLSKWIDTNKFSLHAMYRMRLIRAYLGASRPAGERRPDPFTGFDDKDNLYMEDLRPPPHTSAATAPGTSDGAADGEGAAEPALTPNAAREIVRAPLHVVNVALNLVAGGKLAWQERKAAAFTISPLHAGSAEVGYRRTSLPDGVERSAAPGSDGRERPHLYGGTRGLTLGTAMTISGAAANPNMGYFSSPIVTFLMTLFNARLGWWLGNPGPAGKTTFFRSSPEVGVRPILDEMFGLTSDRSPYVQLSDGGHFENLGLYEMVRRRCKFIVVSDGSCDPDCSLDDLGNAIRKIRIDMGIPIEFDGGFDIFPRSRTDATGGYWALGRVRYSVVDRAVCPGMDPDTLDGTLIYLKPAFYGTEPRDVFNYAQANADFPHQSTVDQFFGESQFESYRALGSYVIDLAVQGLDLATPAAGSTPAEDPKQGSLGWFEFRLRERAHGRSATRPVATSG